ncbi:MAG: epoxyqueuosine reductase QueH [Actinobacteria bacterium]|nr:epoxyqueuosine reductase QueH [Actinomycetota bacterium]
MRKLLIHACCGPCLIYPNRVLRENSAITVFFFNPNIHPSVEYARRLETLSSYCRNERLALLVGEYRMEEYFRAVTFHENDRCRNCYRLRLTETACAAANEGYDAFTTTLTVSPYQDHEALQEIGEEVAESTGMPFEYHDFRKGFRQSQETAAEIGMHRQAYCGCVFSERERYEKKLSRLTGDALVRTGR